MSIDQNMKNTDKIIAEMSFDVKERESLLRWYSKQNILVHLGIAKWQKTHFHRIKDLYPENDLSHVSLASLFAAIAEYRQILKIGSRKKSDGELSAAGQVTKLRAIQTYKPKKRPKWDELLKRKGDVVSLKREGMSCRDISHYFHKVYKVEVSRQTVSSFLNYVNNKEEE